MKIRNLVLASMFVAMSGGVAAAQNGHLHAVCRDDIQRFCAGKQNLSACLQGSMSLLTNACKQAVGTMQPNAAGMTSPTSDGTKTVPNSAGTYR